MAKLTKIQLEEKLKETEQELKQYQKWLLESETKYNKIIEDKQLQFEKLPRYIEMTNQIKIMEDTLEAYKSIIETGKKTETNLRSTIQELVEENENLKECIKNTNTINDTIIHNSRNAGRKPKSEKKIQEQLQQIKNLLNDGKKEKEIYTSMNISRATYYRLKKLINVNN